MDGGFFSTRSSSLANLQLLLLLLALFSHATSLLHHHSIILFSFFFPLNFCQQLFSLNNDDKDNTAVAEILVRSFGDDPTKWEESTAANRAVWRSRNNTTLAQHFKKGENP